ncbi:YkgJ family cysteine cluster protein [Maribellus sp. YY47]|uniref:YkgJ family cysteine cluster protein n=1 Tax=Maribellus sp. YY47 TaxID=2929486 RepID=UPI002001C6AF|nr:YkgJ family cysteine cluster protein [Maribellus sp. YY47]MCK3684851.1 YkgJ family cysteine cluster protein [Maribellus sp. YY47]
MKNNRDTYEALRDKIDTLSAKLEKEHKNHLMCKAGCDLCCMDYSIFPVEFYHIRNRLKESNYLHTVPPTNDEESCVFLKDHQCTIYEERPIICRTHGLPLLFQNEDGDWVLSACELNFTDFDMDEFTDKNTFPQDKFNSQLFMLNKEFISNFEEKKYNEFDLIPMKDLLIHLT